MAGPRLVQREVQQRHCLLRGGRTCYLGFRRAGPRATANGFDGGPLHFTLSLATARGKATPAGRIWLDSPTAVADDAQPAFDPVINLPAELRMWPEWLAAPRRTAYWASRVGRGAALPAPQAEPRA